MPILTFKVPDKAPPPTPLLYEALPPLGSLRQKGITMQQMLNAPQRAIYVWHNTQLTYPVALRDFIGRQDLRIWPWHGPKVENIDEQFRGMYRTDFVFDHAVEMTKAQYDLLCCHIKPPAGIRFVP